MKIKPMHIFHDGSFVVNSAFQDIQIPFSFPLTFCDPPYGGILNESWDKVNESEMAQLLIDWACCISQHTYPGGAVYIWGGIGTPGNRPFFKFLSEVEHKTDLRLSSLITWKKKRAYGIQWGYLFTREELAYFVKGDPKKPRKFEVPLLDKKRGYEGYDKNHPAKSEYLRRTNVWDDITEIFKGKVHPAEKPTALAKIAIQAHTEPGEFVFDPFAGSGSTGLAAWELNRRFVLIEKDPVTFAKMVDRLLEKEEKIIASREQR
jgi:DNA modification methylase